MSRTLNDRVLALAGLVQALKQVRRVAAHFGAGDLTVMAEGLSGLTLYCFQGDSPERFFEARQAPGESDLVFARRFVDDLELHLGRKV